MNLAATGQVIDTHIDYLALVLGRPQTFIQYN